MFDYYYLFIMHKVHKIRGIYYYFFRVECSKMLPIIWFPKNSSPLDCRTSDYAFLYNLGLKYEILSTQTRSKKIIYKIAMNFAITLLCRYPLKCECYTFYFIYFGKVRIMHMKIKKTEKGSAIFKLVWRLPI